MNIPKPSGAIPPAPPRAPAPGFPTAIPRSRSDWHALPSETVLRLLEVDRRAGLTHAQVRTRRQEFGENRLEPRPGPTNWTLFRRQLHQPLVYVLGIAAGVAGAFGGWVDAVVIMAVVGLNATVGFLQERHAGNAIAALTRLLMHHAHVRRDGSDQRIPAVQLVPGDIVVLQPGDRVPADLRLLLTNELQVDESLLTGESFPATKGVAELPVDTGPADRHSLAFAGTYVVRGHGEGVVCATGDQTQTGHIANLIAAAVDVATPLTTKLGQFSRRLVGVVLTLAVLTFVWGLWRGEPALTMATAAVSLAVGAIPEGLPAAVTIVLAIGVTRMARRNAIVRRLSAVETLGSATVICSDKTGTLTENALSVREILAGDEIFLVSGSGVAAEGTRHRPGGPVVVGSHPALAECLRAGILCNDAHLGSGSPMRTFHGDPTEVALLVAGEKAGLRPTDLRLQVPRLAMIPFGSGHMFRATLHDGEGNRIIYQVGAADRIIEHCSHALDAKGGIVPCHHEAVHRRVAEMAQRGLRVLALARRIVPEHHLHLTPADLERGLTFLGVQAMLDPPRAGVAAAVRRAQDAGIAVKMITGDHLITARTIAGQVGMRAPGGAEELPALSGRDLAAISEADLPEAAQRTSVFARVSPEQKLHLVRALQRRGQVVAVTGDGVNDAPALKQADIGIAMGRSGTDVAQAAADIVLADDNFASIEAAVEEGRGAFDNLVKFLAWIIPTNLSEALLLLVAMAAGLPLPVLPLQLLWINLTDTLLGLPLAFEPKEHDVTRRPPRLPSQPLLSNVLWLRAALVSVVILVGSLSVFAAELHRSPQSLDAARTAVVTVIVLCEVAFLFNCRSLRRPCWAPGFLANRWSFAGAAAMVAGQVLFTASPVMNRLFHSAPLPPGLWIQSAAVALVLFVLVEVEKWLRQRTPARGDASGR